MYEVFVCTHAGVFPVWVRILCMPMCWWWEFKGVLPCKFWTFHLSKLDLMHEAGSNACSGGSTSWFCFHLHFKFCHGVPGRRKCSWKSESERKKEKKLWKLWTSSSEHSSSMSQAQKSPNWLKSLCDSKKKEKNLENWVSSHLPSPGAVGFHSGYITLLFCTATRSRNLL